MKSKLTLVAVIAMVAIAPAMATVTDTDRKTPTSKSYVDTTVDTKQNKIPVAGTNASTAGTSVVMYTGTAGTVGERGIYDGSNTYNAGSDSGKLVTAGALNGAVAAIPTMETTKLTCANSPTCSLWTVTDHNVYGQQQQQQ